MLIKKQEENKEEESKRASTFGSWVWENLKTIGEEICVTKKMGATTEETEERIDIKIHEETYIVGNEVERIEIECTLYDLIKTLSKEEWDWVAMDPKVVKKYKLEDPSEWSPPEDPRPEWRIKETQIQEKEEEARRNLRRDKVQPKKIPAPKV